MRAEIKHLYIKEKVLVYNLGQTGHCENGCDNIMLIKVTAKFKMTR